MLDAKRLKRLFQGLLIASFVPGCGGVDRDQFTSNACEGKNDLDGVTPTAPVDFLELRQTFSFVDPPTTNVMATQGVACSKATGPACTDALNALMVTGGWSMPAEPFGVAGSETRHLVFTRADEVGSVTTFDGLETFLAPIENPRDAIFLIRNGLSGHSPVCDERNAVAVDDGFNVLTTSGMACGEGTHRDEHLVHVSSTGEITVKETVVVETGDPNCAIGRRPEGLVPSGVPRQTRSVGNFFARAAHLEAASVFAFERLEKELRSHRAPRTLIRDARRARNDEVRHARMTRRIAKKNGMVPAKVQVEPVADRAWFEFVKENAIEGCIRETFGALIATYQAKNATDRHIRRAMEIIAADETRHASLAWRVAKWAEAKLSAEERAELQTLQRAEIQRMTRTLAQEDTNLSEAGFPGQRESLRLLNGFAGAIGLA